MDLKNYQVTVREILANPAAKAVIRRELLSLAGNIPQEKRDRILAALKEA